LKLYLLLPNERHCLQKELYNKLGLCNYLFPTNALVAMITSDALIALFFAYIIIPPEFRKGFYKQEFFHKTAITYFLIFSLISVLFGVII